MKKSLGPLVLVLFVLVLAAPPAAADAFGFDLGVHGGAVGTDGGNGSTFVGGAQARFHLIWLLAVEGRASYYTDTVDSKTLGSIDVKNVPFQVSAMIYPIKLPKFGLYLLGGGTYSSLTVSGSSVTNGDVTKHKWSAHAGAGVDISLGKSISLNGDVRYVFLNADTVDEALSAAAADYNGDFWAATVGLNFKVF